MSLHEALLELIELAEYDEPCSSEYSVRLRALLKEYEEIKTEQQET